MAMKISWSWAGQIAQRYNLRMRTLIPACVLTAALVSVVHAQSAPPSQSNTTGKHLERAGKEVQAAGQQAVQETKEAARKGRDAAKQAANEAAQKVDEAGQKVRAKSEAAADEARAAVERARVRGEEAADEGREALRETKENAEDAVARGTEQAKAALERAREEARALLLKAADGLAPNAAEDRAERQRVRNERWAELRTHLSGQPSDPAAIAPPLREELEHHARRMARLERIRRTAADVNDNEAIAQADALIARENARHERRVAVLSQPLSKGAKP
jgi:hypothetical protein